MEKLLKAIASSRLGDRVSLLPQALMYGESGVDFLIESLSDRSLEVRAKAYELLHGIESKKARNAIAPGLLLNSGDKIYSVYQSEISFSDDGYYLNDSVKYLDEIDLLVNGEEYFYYRQEEEFCKSKRLFCYLNQEEAEQKAETIHRKLIQNEGIGGLGFDWGWREQDPTIEQWCRDNLVDKQQDFKYWQNRSNLLDYLYLPENIKLLSKFWKDGVGHFAFVEEEYIQQKVYLRIGEKLTKRTPEENTETELIARPKGHKQKSVEFLVKAWKSDRHKLYLLSEFIKYGELGIDFLINCLNDGELEVRAKAYELLQGVESEKVRDAIAPGLLFNPGDEIYSVYQAGMGFDDVMYYLVEDYVDYDHQLHILTGINCNCDYRDYAKRKRCYINKTQAEIAAETLHRQLIKERNVSLEWRRANPDFNLNEWCISNNIAYQKEEDELTAYDPEDYVINMEVKELIGDNQGLIDNFRRSRYLYHPKHIDTWCKDNDVPYEQICDGTDSEPWNEYWNNYNKIFEYLDLPENIELFSKFWKDGIGHMAFIKEEIVQQTAYVKIGKKLDREPGEDKIFAVPKEFEAEAAKLLVEIIDSQSSERKTRSKARKMLQENDWDEIPF